MRRRSWLMFLFLPVWTVVVPTAISSGVERGGSDTVFDLSLEELLEVPVSGVLRKSSSPAGSSSAVFVVTSEDIRRMGALSIPEILRSVPGIHIGRVNGNLWTINARSLEHRYSHELLVLLDGRSVYSPLTNGVYWSRIDTVIEDIDRIEVIRGPGGSLWGANAAKGIVNIVTKDSRRTLGGLAQFSGGTAQYNNGEVLRYGFRAGKTSSRFYVKRTRLVPSVHPPIEEQSRQPALFEPEAPAHDGREFLQLGWRSDVELGGEAALTVQGDLYSGTEEETRISLPGVPTDKDVDVGGGNLLARYHREISSTSSTVMHFYFDRTSQEDDAFKDVRNTYDLDFQHNFAVAGQEVLWGLGFRYVDNDTGHTGNSFTFALDPEDRDDRIFSFFLQDELHPFDPRLSLTLGAKYEHNDYTGSELQPSGKMSFAFDGTRMLWLSVSRAVSTPSRTAADGYLDLSRFNDAEECRMAGGQFDSQRGCIRPISEEGIDSNVFISYEAGYRTKIGKTLYIDNAFFYDDHTRHNIESSTIDYIYGYELNMKYQPVERWRLQAALTWHDGENDGNETEDPLDIANWRFHLSSFLSVREDVDLDVTLYWADDTRKVDGYTLLDFRFEYRPVENVALSVLVRNPFAGGHVEGRTDATRANTSREPAAIGTLIWRF